MQEAWGKAVLLFFKTIVWCLLSLCRDESLTSTQKLRGNLKSLNRGGGGGGANNKIPFTDKGHFKSDLQWSRRPPGYTPSFGGAWQFSQAISCHWQGAICQMDWDLFNSPKCGKRFSLRGSFKPPSDQNQDSLHFWRSSFGLPTSCAALETRTGRDKRL